MRPAQQQAQQPAASPEAGLKTGRRIALVTPLVADERISHALQLFASVLWAFKGAIRTPWTVAPAESADVLVVHEEDSRLGAWRAQGKPAVSIATGTPRDPGQPLSLQYPFGAAQVLSVLEQLDEQLSRGTQPVPGARPGGVEQPDPWSFVEALVTFRQVENDQAWLVASDGRTPVLWVRGDAGAWAGGVLTVQALRAGTLAFSRLQLRKSAEPAAGLVQRSGMELCWFAGLHASGVLSPELGAGVPYRLARMPSFAQLKPLPAQLRLAVGLSSRPASLEQMVQAVPIPRGLATRTFNALYTCGLLEAARRKPGSAHGVRAEHGFARLLHTMRRRLGLAHERL